MVAEKIIDILDSTYEAEQKFFVDYNVSSDALDNARNLALKILFSSDNDKETRKFLENYFTILYISIDRMNEDFKCIQTALNQLEQDWKEKE